MHATLSRLDGINENITVLIFNSPPARGVLRFLSAVVEHSFDGSIWIRPTFPVLFMDFFCWQKNTGIGLAAKNTPV